MTAISFIHTSDVHLGHQQFNLEERFEDFGRAFAQVVQAALERQVNFLLIGGDFFHKRAIDAETLRQSLELLAPLKEADIPVVAIEGNHDKAFYHEKSSWLNLLNNMGYLKLLKPVFREGKPELQDWDPTTKAGSIIEIDGVRIIGLGYLGATTGQRLTEVAEMLEPSDKFTIVVLHAAVDKLMGQDLGGVKKEVLERFRGKVDYIALGHIHARHEIDDWVYNPGALENCHIDEAKEGRQKGFYHVRVEGKTKIVEYIESVHRPVALVNVDITGVEDPAGARMLIMERLQALSLKDMAAPMLQVVMTGTIDFSTLTIDTAAMVREIKEVTGCLYAEVQNRVNMSDGETQAGTGERFSRQDIELQVLHQLVTRQCPQYRDFTEQLVELALKVKESALAGEPAEEILHEVAKLAFAMPEIKGPQGMVAAAAGEDGEGAGETEAG